MREAWIIPDTHANDASPVPGASSGVNCRASHAIIPVHDRAPAHVGFFSSKRARPGAVERVEVYGKSGKDGDLGEGERHFLAAINAHLAKSRNKELSCTGMAEAGL